MCQTEKLRFHNGYLYCVVMCLVHANISVKKRKTNSHEKNTVQVCTVKEYYILHDCWLAQYNYANKSAKGS